MNKTVNFMGWKDTVEVEIFLDELREYFRPVISIDDKKGEIKTTWCNKKALMKYLEKNLLDILPAVEIYVIEIVKMTHSHPKTNYNCVLAELNVEYA